MQGMILRHHHLLHLLHQLHQLHQLRHCYPYSRHFYHHYFVIGFHHLVGPRLMHPELGHFHFVLLQLHSLDPLNLAVQSFVRFMVLQQVVVRPLGLQRQQ
jgi:hypothetical protein